VTDALAAEETTLVARFRLGDRSAARTIIQRYNRRFWRLARGIVDDDTDAEEALHNAYVRALTSISTFRGESSLATWMARIVVNEALRRRAARRDPVDLDEIAESLPPDHPGSVTMPRPFDPEIAAARQQVRQIVERAVDALPAPFRVVFMMRIVEQMSIEETAAALDIPLGTAKTRLHRANQQLRAALGAEFAAMFDDAFPFEGARCERLTQSVLDRMAVLSDTPSITH
jgi:RNA polymerase sigma-70 factor (ECF subfamily)